MNVEDKQKLDDHLKAIAEIMVRNTQKEDLKSFESIELAVREQMLTVVSPAIGRFFLKQQQEQKQEEKEQWTVLSEK
jgi:hypothetical protein